MNKLSQKLCSSEMFILHHFEKAIPNDSCVLWWTSWKNYITCFTKVKINTSSRSQSVFLIQIRCLDLAWNEKTWHEKFGSLTTCFITHQLTWIRTDWKRGVTKFIDVTFVQGSLSVNYSHRSVSFAYPGYFPFSSLSNCIFVPMAITSSSYYQVLLTLKWTLF